ncbi:MAG: SRPBCC domain-containing protein [Acidimicrobiales bacterium]
MADDPLSFTVEHTMGASPPDVFRAWTEAFDTWFASPGAIRMSPVVGEPYWFEVIHDGSRHPHYGRFLALEPDRLIEQTWVTGEDGTEGAETVVGIELDPTDPGTILRLTHSGFANEESAHRHAEAWPQILMHLDDVLTSAHSHGVA